MEFGKQYLSYDEYVALGGTLEETPFSILELEARKNVDKYTFGRLIDLEEQINEVKLCVYNLINLINAYNIYMVLDKSIANESIDGYSVSYNLANESTSKTKTEEIKSIIKTYLAECKLEDGTPYLYCGV